MILYEPVEKFDCQGLTNKYHILVPWKFFHILPLEVALRYISDQIKKIERDDIYNLNSKKKDAFFG